MSESLTELAHAKVNLFLRVLSREADGYHGLETLFCRLELADTLTAERREGRGVTLDVEGQDTDIGPPESNLAVRAAQAALATVRTPFAVHLTLTKRIPIGAGLGGGSSDAAAALRAVNGLANHAIPRGELFQLAARIGADVPFCLGEATLGLAWGHGERMLGLPALPTAPVLLVTPPVAVRTAEAYGWLDEAQQTTTARRGALALDARTLGSWSDIARMAGNDFESVVFGRLAAVRDGFEALARTGPLLCRMTGSGSTLVAVYRTEKDRDDARMTLGKRYGSVTATRTL